MDQSAIPGHPERAHDTPFTALLRAVIDRIIPPDHFPGAWDAGAGAYILGQLAGQLYEQAPAMKTGFAALDAEARLAFGRAFVALAEVEQDLLLAAVERGDVHAEWPIEPTAFFTLLVELTAEGYYSDPGNGGNRDEVAWRMIGYQTRVPEQ
jgi:Gluconate 2-dehydrogenase subunit 3